MLRQRMTNTVGYHLYVESKKYNKLVVTSGDREGGEGKCRGRGVKSTSYYV